MSSVAKTMAPRRTPLLLLFSVCLHHSILPVTTESVPVAFDDNEQFINYVGADSPPSRTYDLTFSVGSEFVVLVLNDSTEGTSLSATVTDRNNLNNTLRFEARNESYVDPFTNSLTPTSYQFIILTPINVAKVCQSVIVYNPDDIPERTNDNARCNVTVTVNSVNSTADQVRFTAYRGELLAIDRSNYGVVSVTNLDEIDTPRLRWYATWIGSDFTPTRFWLTMEDDVDVDLFVSTALNPLDPMFPNSSARNRRGRVDDSVVVFDSDLDPRNGGVYFAAVYALESPRTQNLEKIRYRINVEPNFRATDPILELPIYGIFATLGFMVICTFVLAAFLVRRRYMWRQSGGMMGNAHGGARRVAGATKRELKKLTVRKYKLGDYPPDDAQCVICLGDYEEGEQLRDLKCHHHFHKECVDQWLKLKKFCPQCRQHIRKAQDVHGIGGGSSSDVSSKHESPSPQYEEEEEEVKMAAPDGDIDASGSATTGLGDAVIVIDGPLQSAASPPDSERRSRELSTSSSKRRRDASRSSTSSHHVRTHSHSHSESQPDSTHSHSESQPDHACTHSHSHSESQPDDSQHEPVAVELSRASTSGSRSRRLTGHVVQQSGHEAKEIIPSASSEESMGALSSNMTPPTPGASSSPAPELSAASSFTSEGERRPSFSLGNTSKVLHRSRRSSLSITGREDVDTTVRDEIAVDIEEATKC